MHGSAALGGWVPHVSDLDYLAVVADDVSSPRTSWSELGDHLAEVTDAPIELSLIPESLARRPRPPWRFLLHVATDGSADRAGRRVVLDDGDGDPDLLLHLAVVRAHGVAVHGPEPARLVGTTSRGAILDHLASELDWGATNADARYAVLNACRAWHYVCTGELVSKLEGGRAAISALPRHAATIEAALRAQVHGRELGALSEDGHALVREVGARLVAATR